MKGEVFREARVVRRKKRASFIEGCPASLASSSD
jgi:hypothetical protein